LDVHPLHGEHVVKPKPTKTRQSEDVAKLVEALRTIRAQKFQWLIKEESAHILKPVHDNYHSLACAALVDFHQEPAKPKNDQYECSRCEEKCVIIGNAEPDSCPFCGADSTEFKESDD